LLQSRTSEAIVWFEKGHSALPGIPFHHSRLASAFALEDEAERHRAFGITLFLSTLTNAFSSSRFQPASGLEHLALTAAAKVGERGYGSSPVPPRSTIIPNDRLIV
jgi:hypothetical protein